MSILVRNQRQNNVLIRNQETGRNTNEESVSLEVWFAPEPLPIRMERILPSLVPSRMIGASGIATNVSTSMGKLRLHPHS